MTVVPTVLSITAGICLFAGSMHLFIGLSRRPRDWVHITFALSSLAIAANALAVLAIHTSESVDAYVVAHKYAFGPAGLGVVLGILWFVAFYTGVRPRRFLLAMSLWFTGIAILQLVLPYGILFAEVSGLREITMPWGEQFVVAQATPHPWRLVVDLYLLVFFGFLLYATYRQYRRGDRGRAWLLALAILLLFLASAFDTLVDTGVVNSIYVTELAYLGFVVAMSVRLYSEIIQTETELDRYRVKLEAMVDERTLELQQANDQLAREIDDRMQIEEELRRVAYERGERVKELDCLFGISDLAGRRDISLDEILQGTAELIPLAWQDPDATVARIVLEDREFKTEHFQEVPLRLASDLVVGGQPAGIVEVRLLAERAPQHRVPFPPEEQRLLEVIAERLGRIVERMRAEEALHRRVEELAGLNRIAHTIATATDLPAILQQVSEVATDLFAARYTHVIWSEGGGGDNSVQVGYEPGSGQTGPTPLDLSLSELPVVSRVLREAKSQIIPDVRSLTLADGVREFLVQRNIRSVLIVPLVIRRAAVGVLSVASDLPGRLFSADEVRLAETIATDLAAAIEGTRLFEQAQAVAVSEERSRIARDLHDSVTQTIYSASLIAEALPRVWVRNPEQVTGSLTTLGQLIRGALAEMRTLLFELRPAALEESSLGRLLHQLADVLTGRTQTPVEVTVQGQTELPPEVKVTLYRMAQEAFNNIAKHAGATQVTATLQNLPDRITLTIQDDGQGFDPDSVPPERMGLRITRERAEAIGADLVVRSELGRGTEVRVEWRKDEGAA
jgi:signal transduction histidine kinase